MRLGIFGARACEATDLGSVTRSLQLGTCEASYRPRLGANETRGIRAYVQGAYEATGHTERGADSMWSFRPIRLAVYAARSLSGWKHTRLVADGARNL